MSELYSQLREAELLTRARAGNQLAFVALDPARTEQAEAEYRNQQAEEYFFDRAMEL